MHLMLGIVLMRHINLPECNLLTRFSRDKYSYATDLEKENMSVDIWLSKTTCFRINSSKTDNL